MSFREKSAWASLISLLIVYLVYFSIVFSGVSTRVALATLAAAVVIHLALLIAAHTVFAISSQEVLQRGDEPPRDERDVAIDLRSFRASSYVLGTGVLLWCLAVFVGIAGTGITDVAVQDAMTACQLLFAGFVVANLTYYTVQVTGYRRTS